jgi:hypothetical protein
MFLYIGLSIDFTPFQYADFNNAVGYVSLVVTRESKSRPDMRFIEHAFSSVIRLDVVPSAEICVPFSQHETVFP